MRDYLAEARQVAWQTLKDSDGNVQALEALVEKGWRPVEGDVDPDILYERASAYTQAWGHIGPGSGPVQPHGVCAGSSLA